MIVGPTMRPMFDRLKISRAKLAYIVDSTAARITSYNVCYTKLLRPEAHGQGIGTELYRALLDELKCRGKRTAIACISLPNSASVVLHEKLGFMKVGHFPGIGIKFSRNIDVGYWQLDLEA